MEEEARSYSVFADFKRHIHTGTDVTEAVEKARQVYLEGGVQTVVVFDDVTGNRTEIDPRGDVEQSIALLDPTALKRSGPGRPKLGVVSREVSLLPRHWDWLNAQPGGASGAIRRLVDDARKQFHHRDLARVAKDAVCRFMSVVGGDLPNYEEALRALYADRFADAEALTTGWPDDLRNHVKRLMVTASRCHAQAVEEAQGRGAAM